MTYEPPYMMDAEEAVIGALLIQPLLFNRVAEIVTAADFFITRLRMIWQAIEELQSQGIEGTDIVVVSSHLKQKHQFAEVGGDAYLLHLTASAPSSFHAADYARVVELLAVRRRLLELGSQVQALAVVDEPLDNILARCEDAFYQVTRRWTGGRSWEFVPARELIFRPPVDWLIAGKVPARGLAMLFGPSGVFKSFIALDWAVSLSWSKPVVYVLAEGADGMPSRLQAFEKHHGKQAGELTFCVGAVDMFSDAELTAFKRIASRHKPALIVVDTFAMCTGDADENSTRDMKRIVEGARRITEELACAVLLVHHTNKEGRVERGNQSLRNACETVIRVNLVDDLVAVESQKSRDRGRFKTYYLKRLPVELGYKLPDGEAASSLVLLPAERIEQTAADDLTEAQVKVLEALAVEPSASFKDLSETTELSRNTVASVVRRLQKLGLILEFDGQMRRLTDAGRAAIDAESTESSESSESRGLHLKNDYNPLDSGTTPSTKTQQIELTPQLFDNETAVSRPNQYTYGA